MSQNENSIVVTRLCAVALLLGSLLSVIAHLLHPEEPHSAEEIRRYIAHTPSAHVLLFFALALVLMGLPTLFAHASQGKNMILASALPVLYVGLCLSDLVHCPVEFGALPAIYHVVPDRAAEIYMQLSATPFGFLIRIATPLVIAGVFLFLVGTWKSATLPAWPRWLLVASVLAMIAATFNISGAGVTFTVLLYAALGIYGLAILRNRSTRPIAAERSSEAEIARK